MISNDPVTVYPWYAIRVRSHSEQLVRAALEGRGYPTFLPTYRSRRRWSDRVKEVQAPLFNGYVFCRFNFQERLPIMQTGGVLDIVTCGKQALPVPDHEIAAIKLIVESKLPARPWPFLKVGQRVKIQQGSLAGLEGVLLSIKKNLNVVVSIEMLQRSVAVEIEGDWIEPTSPLCLSDIA